MSVSFLVRKEVVVQRKTNEQADKRWLFCLINDSIDFHDCLPRVDLQILFCPWTIWTWSLDWRPTDIGLEESCSNTLQQLTKTEIDCELVANRPALPSPRGWIEPADLKGGGLEDIKVSVCAPLLCCDSSRPPEGRITWTESRCCYRENRLWPLGED